MDFVGLFSGKGEKAVDYMNKKYGVAFGDEFALVDAEYAGFTSVADSFTMSSKLFPEFYIRVKCRDRKYRDDYMEVYYYKQYQEYMQPICEEILGECKVLMNFSMNPTNVYDEKTTFEDFLHADRKLKDAVIMIKNDTDIEQKAVRLVEKIKEMKVPHVCIRFITVKDYEDVKGFENIVQWGKYERNDSDKKILKYYDYSLDKNYEVWDKGEGDWYL